MTTIDTWGAWTAAAAAGILPAAGANKMFAIYVSGADLSADSNFVRVTSAEGDSTAVDAGVIAILGKPKHAEDVMKTAIA